jgi:hypothetical protein
MATRVLFLVVPISTSGGFVKHTSGPFIYLFIYYQSHFIMTKYFGATTFAPIISST